MNKRWFVIDSDNDRSGDTDGYDTREEAETAAKGFAGRHHARCTYFVLETVSGYKPKGNPVDEVVFI